MVRVFVDGELEEIDPAWRGWRLERGELVSPEGWTFTPSNVTASELYRRLIVERGERDRTRRMAVEADPANRANIQRLAVLQASLEATVRAMDEITNRLTPLERNRLFSAATQANEAGCGSRSDSRARRFVRAPLWRRAVRG